MAMQVFKKKDADADELMGLSSFKRGGKKAKKGAEKPAEKPVRPLHLSLPSPWQPRPRWPFVAVPWFQNLPGCRLLSLQQQRLWRQEGHHCAREGREKLGRYNGPQLNSLKKFGEQHHRSADSDS